VYSHFQSLPTLNPWQKDSQNPKVPNRTRRFTSESILQLLDLARLFLPQEPRRLGQGPRQAVLVEIAYGRGVELSLDLEGGLVREEGSRQQTSEIDRVDGEFFACRFQVDFERLGERGVRT
jgi:hypothetical protein